MNLYTFLYWNIPTTLEGGYLKNITYISDMVKMQILEILYLSFSKYIKYHI